MKDGHKTKRNGVSSLLFLACVSCIPTAAEYTANIQTQGPGLTLKNHLLFLHVAQLKDMPSLKPLLQSCYWFIQFKSKKINVVKMAADHLTN